MTQRRHFKDLVRARMARTGESYNAARAQLAKRARTEVVGVPLVIVPVTNMDRARDFYCSGLGLPVRSMSPAWTVVGDDGQLIALEPGGATGVDLRIGVEVVEIRGSLRAVAAAGGVVESQNGGVARVLDPDGNRLRLIGRLEE